MTPYESLRQRLNALLPERLTLRFGCEVRLDQQVWRYIGPTDFAANPLWECVYSPFATTKHTDQLHVKPYQLLGSPLNLADVLRAIESTGWNCGLSVSGKKATLYRGGAAVCKFDLSKPVSEWPEETINSILSLLG